MRKEYTCFKNENTVEASKAERSANHGAVQEENGVVLFPSLGRSAAQVSRILPLMQFTSEATLTRVRINTYSYTNQPHIIR